MHILLYFSSFISSKRSTFVVNEHHWGLGSRYRDFNDELLIGEGEKAIGLWDNGLSGVYELSCYRYGHATILIWIRLLASRHGMAPND